MRIDLPDDPAVIAIAAATGLDEFAVVGRLHRLWGWANRQSRSGHANCVTPSWVDRYVSYPGFAAAVQSAGWLSITEVGIEFPNFERHNGENAKNRALSTERKRKQREASAATSVTQTSRSGHARSVTREEKRRGLNPPPPSLDLDVPSVLQRLAVEAGLPAWDEEAFSHAQGEAWHEYKARTFQLLGIDPKTKQPLAKKEARH
jgi:hypothetical protein